MTERQDVRQSREQKLEELTSLGLPALPRRYGPTRPSEEIKQDYGALEGTRVRVAGRLMRVRLMGKAAFAHIQDAAGQLQLYFKLDVLGDKGFEYFRLLDVGDIIGAQGTVFKTRTDEVSVQVESCVLLAKAYLPLPDKFHGLSDVETRYRRRYLDLIANAETRELFYTRSSLIRGLRKFLDGREFIEVETPLLQPIYGGAAANPFVTHYASLDADVYLRIATELYLKRLIVGGMQRVYEIGKDFRNEGFSRKHSPEFTMLELYQAYADYQDIMELTETMIATVTQEVIGSHSVQFGDHEIDLAVPWRRTSVRVALLEYTGVDLETNPAREDLLAVARQHRIDVAGDATVGKLLDELVSTCIEPRLIQPTFLHDFPIEFPGNLLARSREDNPRITERFEAYMGGMEILNGFTELNDPREQRERMDAASHLRGDEHQEIDQDFVRALEQGMPPTGGVGIGLDRLMMIVTGAQQIRETILFPLLRQHEDPDAES